MLLAFAAPACVLEAGGGPDSSDQPDAAADSPDADLADAEPGLATTCGNVTDAIICDGFETGGFDLWTTEDVAGGTLEIVTDPVYRGTGSLHSAVPTAGTEASLILDITPITTGTIYGRFYMFIPAGQVWTNIEYNTVGPDGSSHHHQAVVTGGEPRWYAVAGPDLVNNTPLPTDAWMCQQFAVVLDDVAGSIEAFLDGEPLYSTTGVDTLPTGDVSRIRAGILFAAAGQGPAEIFLDEFAVATAPIACD